MISNYFRKFVVAAAAVLALVAGSAAVASTTVDDSGANGLRIVQDEKVKKAKKADDVEVEKANGL